MEPGRGAASRGIRVNATISEIGTELLSSDGPLPVLDAEGAQVGTLDRQRALQTFLT